MRNIVGQTEQRLRDRFYLHCSDIDLNRGTPLTCHFNENNHTLRDMQCCIVERVFGTTKQDREDREDFWIDKLKTLAPYGLNVERTEKIRKSTKKQFHRQGIHTGNYILSINTTLLLTVSYWSL